MSTRSDKHALKVEQLAGLTFVLAKDRNLTKLNRDAES